MYKYGGWWVGILRSSSKFIWGSPYRYALSPTFHCMDYQGMLSTAADAALCTCALLTYELWRGRGKERAVFTKAVYKARYDRQTRTVCAFRANRPLGLWIIMRILITNQPSPVGANSGMRLTSARVIWLLVVCIWNSYPYHRAVLPPFDRSQGRLGRPLGQMNQDGHLYVRFIRERTSECSQLHLYEASTLQTHGFVLSSLSHGLGDPFHWIGAAEKVHVREQSPWVGHKVGKVCGDRIQ